VRFLDLLNVFLALHFQELLSGWRLPKQLNWYHNTIARKRSAKRVLALEVPYYSPWEATIPGTGL
jgi:hypothetical protein